MGRSDLYAVAARLAALARERAQSETMRASLLAEDEDLQVAERVLKQLGALYAPEAPAYPGSSADALRSGAGVLRGALSSGIEAGRSGWDRVRSAVGKRLGPSDSPH